MEDFADTYLAGATPIPCVRCNQTVKFRDLLAHGARSRRRLPGDGALCAARVRRGGAGTASRRRSPERDQSYFLFATTRAQLEFLRFPLGDMPKSDVRAFAAEFGLKVADKPDSQDICFVPSGKYHDVVEKLRPGAIEPGEIVHVDGRVMGEHDGVINYTVGQRRGLGRRHRRTAVRRRSSMRRSKRVIVGPREALAVRAWR